MSEEKAWYENALKGVGEVVGDALAIKTAGYLKGLAESEGVSHYPQAEDQLPPRVDGAGRNMDEEDSGPMLKQGLMIGGGVLIVLAFVLLLIGGRK